MVVAKANKMLGFLKRNCAGLVNREALLRLYHSLVRSHVCFCSQVRAPQSTVITLFLVEGIQEGPHVLSLAKAAISHIEIALLS